ncbi:porin [Teredinibacter turnerae]|uniref:porin n=1 Tax=Teredinibacter turnerae TaxID=2426 RepID=UPI00038060A5|nr:porin [Teredinibacter turnerae]
MKKKQILPGLIALSLSGTVAADPEIFGLMHLVTQYHETTDTVTDESESVVELESFFSRLGVRGSEKLDNGLEVFYHYELGIEPNDNVTWTKRNSFLGVKGEFGRLAFGRFDTPFKRSQGKVDVFGDQVGDILHVITVNDNRLTNMVEYTTPNTLHGWQFKGLALLREDPELEDGYGGSAVYTNGDFYVALAMDSDIEEVDTSAVRVSSTYKIGPVQVGGMYEQFSPQNDADDVDAKLVSVKYRVGGKWDLKAQYAMSDVKFEGAKSGSVGADYHLTPTFKLTSYLTRNSSDETPTEKYAGVGGVLKF